MTKRPHFNPRLIIAVGALLTALAFAPHEVAAATPIQQGAPTALPPYSGAPAASRPVRARRPPQNPGMARNGKNNVHDDSWMTDSYWRVRGPSGKAPTTVSTALGRVCITVTFDRHGRIVATCSSLAGPHLYLLDPVTLDILADLTLPFVPPPPDTDPTQNTAGGAYFYLDAHDRAVVATSDKHIMVFAEVTGPGGPGFVLARDYDISATIPDDRVTSVLPDWDGNLWFVGRYHGYVGAVEPLTGRVRSIRLDEEIENSFAIDRDGTYIVTDRKMYRLGLTATGMPVVVWEAPYQNSGVVKPGQFNAGSGTTPTLLRGGYVAITDNADQMNVVVFRTAATLPPGTSRLVCEVPVFAPGAGDTENSLIGAGTSLIVENNYGYHVAAVGNGAVTTPGLSRVDLDPDGNGCHVVWTSAERAPSAVPKLSLRRGLIHTITKDPDPVNTTADAWFWTAIDFHTGATVWKRLIGTGTLFNNHYAGVALGAHRAGYVGVLGGLVAVRDAP